MRMSSDVFHYSSETDMLEVRMWDLSATEKIALKNNRLF